jgi:hypothetical protein
METINVDITYTAADLQKSYTLHFKKMYPVKSKMLIIFGILIISLGAIMLLLKSAFNDTDWLPWFYVIFGVLAIIYHFWQYATIGKRMFKKLPDFKHAFHYVITDEGIQTASATASSEVKWEHYHKAIITDDLILLYPNKFRYNLFPKRFFLERDFKALYTKIKSLGIE